MLAEGRVWVDGFGGTAVGGDPALLAQEQWIRAFLISRPTWEVDGDELTLTSGGTTITFLDRKLLEPDFPLDGPRWKVDAVIIKDADLRRHYTTEAWLTFAGNHLTASTGCNTLTATITRDANTLTFTNLTKTNNPCTGESTAVEAAILNTLHAGFTYTIDHNHLTALTPTGTGLDLSTPT